MRQPLKKDAGISALISACLGSIVGSGWLFGPFHAAQIAGPYSLIAWVIGALAISLLAMVYAELSTIMPLSGAVIHFPRISHGELTARIYGWINFLGYVCIAPVETIAILAYSNNFWPGLTTSSGLLTPKGLACAIILLAAFTSLNFLSIRWVLRINNWSIWWKLAIPIITIITLTLWSGHTSNLFIDHQPIKKSWPRILHAIADSGIIFSFLGFRQAVELSGESQNPSRSLPLSIIGSVGIGLILYLGLQFAFLISIPPSSLSNGWTELKFSGMAGPFAGLAAIAGLSWLVKLLYIDAIISPGGTSYIYLTTSARVTLAMADAGWLPRFVQKINKAGTPWLATLISFLAGIIFLFPFPSWQKMVEAISSIALLAYAIGPITLLTLRKKMPHLERPFRLPLFRVSSSLSFIISNFIIYWAGYHTLTILLGLIALFFFIYLLHFIAIKHQSFRSLSWKESLWIFPYFSGLWGISYANKVHMVKFPLDLVYISILSLAILILAIYCSSNELEISQSLTELDIIQMKPEQAKIE